MKMQSDNIMYLILFVLISFSIYRDNIDKKELENKINHLEELCWNLAKERGKANSRIDKIEMKNDSLCFLYLRLNK